MFSPVSNPARPWSSRWSQLARAVGIAPQERLLLALSGGADSVLLLHLMAEADPRPLVHAVHVDHGLRGEESRADARFCENLCRALGVPFTLRGARLTVEGPSLEARARAARYDILTEEAGRTAHATIVTGHHSDDALETLLWRWTRGSSLPGLRGPRASMDLAPPRREQPIPVALPPLRVVRPLLPLRREEVRRLLSDRGLRWREDGSNRDERHTRNRVRHGFLPLLERLCGETGLENLRAFGRAVEELEDRLAGATAHLAWAPAPYASASRGPRELSLGGVVSRAELMRVAPPLRRRALWRLLVEGTGHAPGRALLAAALADLAGGRCTRHAVGGGWILLLRSDELHLLPPVDRRSPFLAVADRQPCLPFPSPRDGGVFVPRPEQRLPIPGIVTLPDGRRISAEPIRPDSTEPLPRSGVEVHVDAAALPDWLSVRWPERGDRFHALGAPGSKPVLRFLADRGLPREERSTVPLVFAGEELLWVAGVELAERARVRSTTVGRLRLTLHGSEARAAAPGRLRHRPQGALSDTLRAG